MASNSEPGEAPRKTLDEIRREIDAEYRCAIAEPIPAVSDVAHDRRRAPARADRRRAQEGSERDDADEDRVDARLAHFREISGRHQAALERRPRVPEEGPRRSGYLIAGLVGCVAGQALLLAFLMVTRYAGEADVFRTSAVVSPGDEAAPAAASIRPAPQESQFSPETRPEADESTAVASSPPPQPSVDVQARVAQEPRTSRQPAVVSAATVRDSVPPPVAAAPRPAPARPPRVAGANDVAESQARLRAALTEWLRTSPGSGAAVETTEPVIVLAPDGRTAKTYVSVTSPVGLIPREQRWELGPRGWYLVDDRQAGLPQPRTPTAR